MLYHESYIPEVIRHVSCELLLGWSEEVSKSGNAYGYQTRQNRLRLTTTASKTFSRRYDLMLLPKGMISFPISQTVKSPVRHGNRTRLACETRYEATPGTRQIDTTPSHHWRSRL